MPGRFSPTGPSEIRYNLLQPEDYEPRLYIGGSPETGFQPTAAPPRISYWGATFRDKQINAATIESGNVATWLMNYVVDPLVPGEQRFVSLGAGNLMRRQLGDTGEAVSGWKALSNRVSPVQNVAGFDQQLKFEDEDFNSENAVREWLDAEGNRSLAGIAAREGFDLPEMLRDARNRDHFVYIQNRVLMHAQAVQNFRNWEAEAGLALKWSSRVNSAVTNYLLTDPTFLPSIVTPSGAVRGAATLAQPAGRAVLRASAGIKGAAQSLVLHAPEVAPALRTGAVASGAASAVRTALRAPAVAHAGLTTALSRRGAIAVELGAYGGAWNLVSQQQRMAESEILFDSPEFQQQFSWSELGLSVGLGATLGFILAGSAGRNLDETRKAVTEAAGGSAESSPIAHSLDNWRAQALVDDAGIRIQRAAERVMGDDLDALAPYLDDEMLRQAGMTRFDVAQVIEMVAEAVGDTPIQKPAILRVISDAVEEGRRLRGIGEEIEDAMGSAIERTGWAEALGLAGRALPSGATADQLIDEARKIMPLVLRRIERQAARIKQGVGPAVAKDLQYWLDEAVELRRTVEARPLTPAELRYAARVEGKLEQLAQDPNLKFGWDPIFDGIAARRAGAYADPKVAFDATRGFRGSPLSKAVQAAAVLQRDIASGKFSGRALDDLQTRLRAARASIAKLAPKAQAPTGPTVAQVMQANATKVVTTRKEAFEALDAIADALDLSGNALLEDGNMVGKLLNGWGLGRFLRRIAVSGTGLDQTVRNPMAILRELAHEFDHQKLRVGDIRGDSTKVHRTLEDVRIDMSVRASELVDEYKRLHDKGKFGSTVRVIKYGRARRDFDRAVIRHIVGVEESSDADVRAMAALWRKHSDEIGETAERIGMFDKADGFFPRLWNVGAVMQDQTEFRLAIMRHLAGAWQKSDNLNMDVLMAMGVVEKRGVSKGEVVFRLAKDRKLNGKTTVKGLNRSDLAALKVPEEEYLTALEKTGPDGKTPLQRETDRIISELTGDDAFTEAGEGRVFIKRPGGRRTPEERAIEETMWSNPELDRFLDYRFLHGATQYIQHTGFRVMNNSRHSERWGINGLTMQQTLDWVSQRRPAGLSLEEQRLWDDGVKTLREKLHYAEGRMPTLRDQTNALGEWLGEVGTASAGSLYGSGIGQAVLSTEVTQALLSRIYGPTDIVRRAGDIFKVALRNREEMRAQIQALGLTIRQHRLHTLERMTGGAVHSEGFQFGLVPKLLAPWMDIFDRASKARPGSGNRTAAVLRAHAATVMTVGGMDFFTQFSRMLHVQSMLDETGRFFQAAERAAVSLRNNAEMLRRIEEQKGASAAHKAWRGIVRKAGFGGNWQVADKMWRAGLLDPERLAVLRAAGEATGALQDTGVFKTLDFNELMTYSAPTAEAQALYDDAFARLRNMMVNTIHKRVSEQSIMQAPTSQANRTWLGRTQLAMTSFARSWYDNNILDGAQMPARAFAGMMMVYLAGETMNRMVRDLWKGRDFEDIKADIEEDPDNFVLRTLTNVPLLGQWSTMIRPAVDALTLNGRRQKVDTGESAAEGAMASITDMMFDTVHGVSPLAEDSEVQARTWRTAARLMPGYRSWWASGLTQGLKAAGGPDIGAAIEGDGRYRRVRARKAEIEPLPEPVAGDFVTDYFPEDLEFLYPE